MLYLNKLHSVIYVNVTHLARVTIIINNINNS